MNRFVERMQDAINDTNRALRVFGEHPVTLAEWNHQSLGDDALREKWIREIVDSKIEELVKQGWDKLMKTVPKMMSSKLGWYFAVYPGIVNGVFEAFVDADRLRRMLDDIDKFAKDIEGVSEALQRHKIPFERLP